MKEEEAARERWMELQGRREVVIDRNRRQNVYREMKLEGN